MLDISQSTTHFLKTQHATERKMKRQRYAYRFIFVYPVHALKKIYHDTLAKEFFVQKNTENYKLLKQGGSNLIPSNHVTFYMQHIVRIK